MASLALIVSIILISIVLIGPLAYLSAILNFPKIIIYILSISAILSGIWFCSIGLPVWYIGLFPIYCGYVGLSRANKKRIQA